MAKSYLRQDHFKGADQKYKNVAGAGAAVPYVAIGSA
jgi:hypothetical protein